MKSARPRVFVALFALLVASPAFGQTPAQTAPAPVTPPPVPGTPPAPASPPAPSAAPAPEDEPAPPAIQAPPPRSRRRQPTGSSSSSRTAASVESRAPRHAVADSFLPTLMGPIGLYHLATAEVGPVNHLRLALHFDWFKDSNFLVGSPNGGDTDTRVDGAFTFGYTVHQYVELFGAILSSSNRNVRDSSGEIPARRDPELIKSFGDLVLGAKTALPVATGQSVGFQLGLRFLSSISDLSISPSSTSLWFGPLYTLDLRPINDVPLRFHASADFYLDNSDNLIDWSKPENTASIYTREVASFAYGIQKSRFRFGVGADLPLEQLTAPVPLDIFGEYHAEIVTASADAAFAAYSPKNRDQQWMTFGVRARVWKGLTVDLGSDIRVRSVGYQYGPPLAPYTLFAGVVLPLDLDVLTKPVIVTRTIEKTVPTGPPPALEAQITGAVKSARDGKGVPNAIISVAGKAHSRVGTDPDGSFQTIMLPPGPAVLEVSAPGFDPTRVTAAVIIGRPSKVDVTLQARIATGNVRGHVLDAKGQPLQASLRFSGAEAFSAQADATGAFSAALPVGPYRVIAEMPTMPPKEVTLDIVEGQDRTLEIVMRPPNTSVTVSGDVVTLKQPLKFKAGSKLDPKMTATLDGLAEYLQDHPEIRSLKVDAYWDNSAGAKGQALTDSQAKAIKDYLVKKGVAATRIAAAGHGAENPLVPNIGPVNKAKNRRVELHVGQ